MEENLQLSQAFVKMGNTIFGKKRREGKVDMITKHMQIHKTNQS